MKSKHKEITFPLVAVAFLAIALLYFLKGIQSEKISSNADLFALVPSDCYALLYIDKAGNFSRFFKSPAAQEVFTPIIPSAFLSIIRHTTGATSCLVAFCKEGTVLYSNPSQKQVGTLEKKVFRSLSTGYPPQIHKKGKREILYYPLKGKDFVGYSYQDGILIAGYNKKLLERTVQQRSFSSLLPPEIETLRKEANKNTPVNLFLQPNKSGAAIFPDSLLNSLTYNGWLELDISSNEDEICSYGSTLTDTEAIPDSICHLLSDTLTKKLQQLLPQLRISSQIIRENGRLYYSACGTLSTSTVNPS